MGNKQVVISFFTILIIPKDYIRGENYRIEMYKTH